MAIVPSITGSFAIYSLILHVPAIVHILSGDVTSTATAQASISNIPPATAVPSGSPVSSDASLEIVPHRS